MISNYDNVFGDELDLISEARELELIQSEVTCDSWKYNLDIMQSLFGDGFLRRMSHE